MSCNDHAPAGYPYHWREWHRGHGCELDDSTPREAHGPADPTWTDTPVLAAKRRVFDEPTQVNLDALIEAVLESLHELTKQVPYPEPPDSVPRSLRDIWYDGMTAYRRALGEALTTNGATVERNPDPRCPKCGYTMCQLFDERPITSMAVAAVPSGKFQCYHCTPANSAKWPTWHALPLRWSHAIRLTS